MGSKSEFSICRLCLSHGEAILNILDDEAKVGFDAKESIEDLLRIEVLTGCELPWVVCESCIFKLKNFSDYKLKCLTSNNIFIERYSETHPSETRCWYRTEAKEVTMAVGEEGLCIVKEEKLDFDEMDNSGCGIVDFPTTSALSVGANKTNYLELVNTCDTLQRETINAQMDSEDDIPRHPLGESEEDCTEDDNGDGEATKDEAVFFECSLEGHMDTKEYIPKDPLGEESEHCSEDDTGDGETRTDLKVFSEFSLEGQANKLNFYVDASSSNDNLPSKSKLLLNNRPYQQGSNSYQPPQSVDGPDDTAPKQVKKNPMVEVCEILNELGSTVKEGKRPSLAPAAQRVEKEFVRKSKSPASCRRTHSCNVCKKSFVQSSHLREHICAHTREKTFNCNQCSKSFLHNSRLRRHMSTHTGEKPFICNICSKSFSRKYGLQTHKLTHTGEKPFKCNMCSKTFSQRSYLRTHIRTHTGEKPFKCCVCNISFSDSSTLRKHMRSHNGEKQFNCNVCLKAFSEKSNLSAHLHTHTK